MGGFVVVTAAAAHPDRIRSLVLVDGGLPLQLGPLSEVPVEQAVHALIGPSLERLRMTFPSQQAYLDYWRDHPALANDWNEYIERSFCYDTTGEPPNLASSVREEAVLADAADFIRADDLRRALAQVTQPVVMLRAPLGMFNQEPPLYPDTAVAAGRALVPHLTDVLVPGMNHYTVALTRRGGAAAAGEIRLHLAA